jgi:hypothetical protein
MNFGLCFSWNVGTLLMNWLAMELGFWDFLLL